MEGGCSLDALTGFHCIERVSTTMHMRLLHSRNAVRKATRSVGAESLFTEGGGQWKIM